MKMKLLDNLFCAQKTRFICMWDDFSSYWFWGWFHSFIPSRMFYLWSQESSSAISDYENCQHAITQNNINIQNKSQKNMQQAQETWGQNKKGFLSCYQKPREAVNKCAICPRQWCWVWRSHIWAFVVLKGSILQRYRLFPRKILLPFLTWILLCQLLLQCKTASSQTIKYSIGIWRKHLEALNFLWWSP